MSLGHEKEEPIENVQIDEEESSPSENTAEVKRENRFAYTTNTTTNPVEGKYVVDFEKAEQVIDSWSELIIRTQATGDFEFAQAYSKEHAAITPELEADIKKVNEAGIPRDIVFDWAW